MKGKKAFVESFPVYLFDIMPSVNDLEAYQKFLEETALASAIDTYQNLDIKDELTDIIFYIDKNCSSCSSNFLESIENQSNIIWSSSPSSIQDFQHLLKMIKGHLEYIQAAEDKDEAINKLKIHLRNIDNK